MSLAQNIFSLSACLATSDIVASIKWYSEFLGCKVEERQEYPDYGFKLAFISLGTVRFELIEIPGIEPFKRESPPNHVKTQGLSQLTFYVEDIDAAWEELSSKDIAIASKPLEYIAQDTKFRAFMIRDNQGNLLEFIKKY